MTSTAPTTAVCIAGAGSWGTALAHLLGGKGVEVRLWARSAQVAADIQRERCNARYLPQTHLPDCVTATDDIAAALRECDCAVVAAPCRGLCDVAARMRPHLPAGCIIVSAAKGLIPATGCRPTETLAEALGRLEARRLAALSGPNLAREVVAGMPTVSVAASSSLSTAEAVQSLFSAPAFRVYTNPDIAGVELGGALKNIIALAAGIVDGLGYGDNTKAALVTRGLAEMIRLGEALGARRETFYGLSGVGDLIATCASPHSRNRTVGHRLATGEPLAAIVDSMSMIAEGVETVRAAHRLARSHGVSMPITEELYGVLYGDENAGQAVERLMRRQARCELEFSAGDPDVAERLAE